MYTSILVTAVLSLALAFMATLRPMVDPLAGELMVTMGAIVSVVTGADAGAWVVTLRVAEAGLLLTAASRAMT